MVDVGIEDSLIFTFCLGEYLPLCTTDKGVSPKPDPIHHTAFVRFEADTVTGEHWQTVGYGMCSLYSDPALHLSTLFRIAVCIEPADRGRIDEELGTFERHDTCRFGIPLIPAD